MYRNQQEPEGAFCVVSGSGARFYGDTRQEAHDAMMANAAAMASTLARFGKDFLPADVAEALPALPDGCEYLVLERWCLGEVEYVEGYETYPLVPYEWRTFAVPRIAGAGNGNAAIAWRSVEPRRVCMSGGGWGSSTPPVWKLVKTPNDGHSGLHGDVGKDPAIVRHRDVAYRNDEIALLPGSFEFVDGAWVPRTAIDLPYRDGFGNPPPALPDGYGIVHVRSPHDDEGSDDALFALPFGRHTLSRAMRGGGTREFAIVMVTGEPVTLSERECLRDGAPALPPGAMDLHDGAWIAYDRDAWERRREFVAEDVEPDGCDDVPWDGGEEDE